MQSAVAELPNTRQQIQAPEQPNVAEGDLGQ